jgi:hypothetical protein
MRLNGRSTVARRRFRAAPAWRRRRRAVDTVAADVGEVLAIYRSTDSPSMGGVRDEVERFIERYTTGRPHASRIRAERR